MEKKSLNYRKIQKYIEILETCTCYKISKIILYTQKLISIFNVYYCESLYSTVKIIIKPKHELMEKDNHLTESLRNALTTHNLDFERLIKKINTQQIH